MHWRYFVEIVRDGHVYPGVTLVFTDDRVESYSFVLD